MKNKKALMIIGPILLATTGVLIWNKFNIKQPDSQGKTQASIKSEVYWTCPMHPQIHQDHPGECPICHMNLVKISKKVESKKPSETIMDERSSVDIEQGQIALLGSQKYIVEKMDLKVLISISGRVLSGNQLAFQTYESDLRYMRPGLSFHGRADIIPEEEIVGIITSVDPIVDPSSRTVRVIGTISKGPKNLPTESSFRGEVVIELKDRLAIPESSVLHTGKGELVYLWSEDNKLTPLQVSLGQRSEGFYEVLKGLSEGDIISSGPNFLIDSEAKIRGAND